MIPKLRLVQRLAGMRLDEAGPGTRATAARGSLVCIATSIHPDYDGRVFRHAKFVAEMGHEVDLIAPWGPPPEPLPPGLRLVPFKRVSTRALRPVQLPRRMLPLLLARPYELYHFHDIDVLPMFAVLKMALRRPVVYDCHENYADEMRYRAYRLPDWTRPVLATAVKWGERLAAMSVRDVVIVVPSQEATFPGPWYRTTIVRNYADLKLKDDRTHDWGDRRAACISIASQYVDNGALLMLDIAHRIHERRPDVQFFMADRFGTDDALRAEVLSRRDELSLRSSFELLPNVPPPRIMDNLNRATIGLVLDLDVPHRRAALPTKIFEYMAAGLPIVAADLPNARSVIEDARCGVLVEPGNPTAFADAVCRLIEDPVLAREMGQHGANAFEDRFNWGVEARRLVPLYRRLLGVGGT